MTDQMPHAMAGAMETFIRAVAAVLDRPDWMTMPLSEAVGVAMKATGGAANPLHVAEAIGMLRAERGLIPTPRTKP